MHIFEKYGELLRYYFGLISEWYDDIYTKNPIWLERLKGSTVHTLSIFRKFIIRPFIY